MAYRVGCRGRVGQRQVLQGPESQEPKPVKYLNFSSGKPQVYITHSLGFLLLWWNPMTKSNLMGVGCCLFISASSFTFQFVAKENGDRNSRQEPKSSNWSGSHWRSACFLIASRMTSPGVALLHWAGPLHINHQSRIWWGIFSIKVPLPKLLEFVSSWHKTCRTHYLFVLNASSMWHNPKKVPIYHYIARPWQGTEWQALLLLFHATDLIQINL